MSTLPPAIRPLLTDLRAALEDLYGNRLVQLVLYGSHARGDTHDESDVDVLVVLKGPVQPGQEIRRMGAISFEIGLKYEVYLSTFPVSDKEYHSKPSPWLQNVRREGVAL